MFICALEEQLHHFVVFEPIELLTVGLVLSKLSTLHHLVFKRLVSAVVVHRTTQTLPFVEEKTVDDVDLSDQDIANVCTGGVEERFTGNSTHDVAEQGREVDVDFLIVSHLHLLRDDSIRVVWFQAWGKQRLQAKRRSHGKRERRYRSFSQTVARARSGFIHCSGSPEFQ